MDQVTSISGDQAFVNNAHFFQAGQLVDVHGSGEGTPYRCSLIVTHVEHTNNSICLNGQSLTSVGVGDLLVIYGAVHEPTLETMPYYQVKGDSGAYMGIARKL